MPRATRIPAILRGARKKVPKSVAITPNTPRLWNAKTRIKQSKGLLPELYKEYIAQPTTYPWREGVSEDVIEFIDQNNPPLEEQHEVLRNPSRYFSRPHHVPVEQRQQVYFPDFGIRLRRTPHLGPFYAAFDVPLNFNKLDMKSYLKSAYNVDVVHVRSAIFQSKVTRERPARGQGEGRMYRPASIKRMTVQLVDPFVWPEEITDFTPWEKDEFWKASKLQFQQQRLESEWVKMHANEKHRKSIAEQASDLLAGRSKWKPTWQSMPIDSRILQGSVSAPPSSSPSSR